MINRENAREILERNFPSTSSLAYRRPVYRFEYLAICSFHIGVLQAIFVEQKLSVYSLRGSMLSVWA